MSGTGVYPYESQRRIQERHPETDSFESGEDFSGDCYKPSEEKKVLILRGRKGRFKDVSRRRKLRF